MIEPSVAQLLAQLRSRPQRLLADRGGLIVVFALRRQRWQQQIQDATGGADPNATATPGVGSVGGNNNSGGGSGAGSDDN